MSKLWVLEKLILYYNNQKKCLKQKRQKVYIQSKSSAQVIKLIAKGIY
jgi:hypothetical protein